MIQITDRSTGQIFDLPRQLKISIEKTNPFLSDQGSQSLPVQLPLTPRNQQLLNWPDRLDRSSVLNMKREVILMAGSYQELCELQITGFSKKSNTITCILQLAESNFYAKAKNVMMQDAFTSIRNDFAGTQEERITKWIEYLEKIGQSTAEDDFLIFQVNVKEAKYSNTQFMFLSQYLKLNFNGSGYLYAKNPLKVEEDGTEITYPIGCFVTPFLKVPYVLKTIFNYFGYNFDEEQLPRAFKKMVILNNTCDAIMGGNLKYWQLVPTCSVYKFISAFMKRFGCVFSFNNNIDVKVHFLKDMDALIESAMDLSEYKASDLDEMEFETYKTINLTCGHSLAPVSSSFNSLDEFKKSYPRYYVTGSGSAGSPLPDGLYYFVSYGLFLNATWTEGGSLKDASFVSSMSLFDKTPSTAKDLENFDIQIEDEALSSILHYMSGWIYNSEIFGDKNVRMLNGTVVYHFTEDQSADKVYNECPIMFCFGAQINNLGFPGYQGTLYGTNDMYGDIDFDLAFESPAGLFWYFYENFETILNRSFQPVSCDLEMPEYMLNDFDMSLPKMIDGQPLWPESFKFELSDDGVKIIEFSSRTLKKYDR